MKANNNWEEWMKETLNDEPVSFDEKHWLAAQKMLEELPQTPPPVKKDRKKFLWMWLFVASVLLGSAGVWQVYSRKENTPKEDASTTATTIKTSPSDIKIPTQEKHNAEQAPSNTLTNPQNISSPSVTSPSVILPSIPPIVPSSSQKPPISNKGSVVVSTATPPSHSNIERQNMPIHSAENAPTFTSKENVVTSKRNVFENQENPSASAKFDKTTDALSLQSVKEPQSPNLRRQMTISPIEKTPSYLLKSVASTPVLQIKTVNTLKKNRGDFYVYLGGSLQKTSNVITPFLGVGYHIPFKHKLGLKVFTQYAQTANLAGIVKTSQQIQYGLGLQQVTYQLTTQSLHFFEGGLGLTYQFKRHEIMWAAQAARMFFAKGNLETIESGSFGAKSQMIAPVSGYMEGLAKWDYGVGLGYAFALNRNIQLRVLGYTGFNDLTKNTYYDNMLIHKTQQLRMGIVFRL